ncbi:hypothetical protein BBJ28_00008498 [Nothophytophthora sp. Chile5]|nr:hypothetical protein BBJ28_00008498 [Nothophytophthora sp. Chile5]
MSSVGSGVCSPTHLNVEVWTSSNSARLRLYANESYSAGGVGYHGLSGIYTTRDFVAQGDAASPKFFPDFWKHYRSSEDLISLLDVATFKANSKYYPPAETFCADGTMGCENYCSKSEACTIREDAGEKCLMLAMMVPDYDPGYFQAVLSNLDIPAYFCFLGYGGMQNYVIDAQNNGTPVVFYHYEPDLFHVTHPGLFERVFLPRTDPARVQLASGQYGENGYGNKTNNLVDVDYPSLELTKYSASILKGLPIGSLFSKLTISDTDINTLLSEYTTAQSDPDPYFRAACNWVKTNYAVWSDWPDRLPLCTFEQHIANNVTGCESGSSEREISFTWKEPNPGNASLPNNCDGGVAALPATIATSRSCEWIVENQRTWSDWIYAKPTCDTSFYTYGVSECASDAKRTVTFFWQLPNATDALFSGECTGGVKLPASVQIDCDYMPTSTPAFAVVAALATGVAGLIAVAMVFVFIQRNAPIIRRSQFEMLELMLIGGFFTCGAAVAYAGQPTNLLCGIRPVLITLGFTTIFGALVLKSLRVYRVFMRSAMKRVKVTLLMILKILSIFYVGDIVIFVVWYAVDFPKPTIKTENSSAFEGTIDWMSCHSSSFIFSALLIFWKALLLFLGLYLSFLIRNVSVDFQESPWIFGSVIVVLVGSLVLMPMSYLVDMPASTYYVFLACALLFCTALIMALMLVPKLFRLKEAGTSSRKSSRPSMKSRTSMGALEVIKQTENETTTQDSSSAAAKNKYQVKPANNNSTIAEDATSTTN